MGNESSIYPVPLAALQEPICTTESRFVLQHPVTLVIHEKSFSFSSVDFKIKCAQTGAEYFTIEGRSLNNKKILRDNVGTPIVNLKEKGLAWSEAYYLFAGDHSDKKICKFYSTSGSTAKFTADFEDVLSPGQMRRVVLKGDWRSKRAVIYLCGPKQGGVPIANVNRRSGFGGDDYFLEIASGVDIALMVIMCIALDIHYDMVKTRQTSMNTLHNHNHHHHQSHQLNLY